MTRCRRLPIALLGLAALVACGDDPVTPIDARLGDARADAALDAAAVDAAMSDATVDAATIDSGALDAVTIDGNGLDGPTIDSGSGPLVTDFSPVDSLANSRTRVTITGAGFGPGTTASFDGVVGTGCSVLSSTLLECSAPPSTVSRGPLIVTTSSGSTTASRLWTYTGVRNETDVAAEADYCNLQFPASFTAPHNTTSPTIYARLYEAGVTDAPGAPSGVKAQLGWGNAGGDPTFQGGWRFADADYNVQVGNDDEFQGTFVTPAIGAGFAYTFRFSFDDGLTFTYCDLDGAGANSGLEFSSTQLGVLTIGSP